MLKDHNQSLGFVPTMGALHQGHISLVKHSVEENDKTVVSIFVNPTQFNNSEDLKTYPRKEKEDIELLAKSGVDAIFIPDVKTMYPNGKNSESFDFGGLENQMEGKFRPGHFDGVGTVVKRLFEIVEPSKAYFGEKDFQQLAIIKWMVNTEKLKVQICSVPIKREEDGLAMSSRNLRLSPEMRAVAPKIYQILQKALIYYKTHSPAETREFVEKEFLASLLKLEYFEIADEETLKPIKEKNPNQKVRGFIACFAGDIRLIDNMSFNK